MDSYTDLDLTAAECVEILKTLSVTGHPVMPMLVPQMEAPIRVIGSLLAGMDLDNRDAHGAVKLSEQSILWLRHTVAIAAKDGRGQPVGLHLHVKLHKALDACAKQKQGIDWNTMLTEVLNGKHDCANNHADKGPDQDPDSAIYPNPA